MRTRAVLSVALSAASVALALWACYVQSLNHSRAQELARIQREWEMLSAANAQMAAVVSAHVWGVANHDLDVTRRAPRVSGGHE